MPTPQTIDLTPFTQAAGGSGRLTGHLARPAGSGPWPGVIVLHEGWGVDDVMLRQTERLARAGYLALMPDLYTQGGRRRCLVSVMRTALSGRGPAYDDIAASRAYLAGLDDCTGSVGAIGFCVGGTFALMSAGTGLFDAASVNYAPLPKKDEELERALAGACPILVSYGRADKALKGAAARVETILDRAGVVHDVKEYPTAGHSFLNDAWNGPRPLRPLLRVSGVGPDPEAAADAWQRIEEFFGTHLQKAAAA
ncbi:dienelactone hydrolase family protein [Streptomyces ipomoeae]|uniref:dienelactone hydrolase family protein n=1 Tax=Streptomyces ipomoeae TaxID=103232 RepID=UPI0011472E29|nr:dienelactone hydrolase family protein [Streptomyces ipomoeae]MDX2939769.1 dienelactone hydrolase family protein [Streptomyces ipomoeae]TQE15668.1 dienelactone hydrolase family protein [Streptomyces ipomoeae]